MFSCITPKIIIFEAYLSELYSLIAITWHNKNNTWKKDSKSVKTNHPETEISQILETKVHYKEWTSNRVEVLGVWMSDFKGGQDRKKQQEVVVVGWRAADGGTTTDHQLNDPYI